jgi:hypothetical protein
MTFKQRLPYFLGGLTLGLIIVVFIWNKKETTFDYGPNARVLKNIRIKERVFSSEALQTMQTKNIDTALISTILTKGNADMWNKLKIDSCTRYEISYKNILLTVKNCESTAKIENITFK